MDLTEVGSVLGDFFEAGRGPSHDQIDQLVARNSLEAGDPVKSSSLPSGKPLGKTKRVRQLLTYATDHAPQAGLDFACQMVALLRADGMFIAASEKFAGDNLVARLAAAFSRLGFTLDEQGALLPTVIDNLSGHELSDALHAYVTRMNLNPDDAALQIGTAKDLAEATARHVILERTGNYATRGQNSAFPVTMAQAFSALDLTIAPDLTNSLDPDPRRRVHQALFLLATAVNQLRNDAGTGHGRPTAPRKSSPLSAADSRLVTRAIAVLSGYLLDVNESSP